MTGSATPRSPQAETPNIDRLAQRGIAFTSEPTARAVCNPSRVSLLTGIEPSKSGFTATVKIPGKTARRRHAHAVFEETWLYCQRWGKIFHGANRPGDTASWDFYFKAARSRLHQIRLDNLPLEAWVPWGPVKNKDTDLLDTKVVNWAISELGKKPTNRFSPVDLPSRTCPVRPRTFRPHPLGKSFSRRLNNDRDDLPAFGKILAREVHDVSGARNFAQHGEDHDMVLKHNRPRAVQSYLATIGYVDAQVGRLMRALDSSEHAKHHRCSLGRSRLAPW